MDVILPNVQTNSRIARILQAPIVIALLFALPGTTLAYVGPSFINIPEMSGEWQGEPYKNWSKLDGHYWDRQSRSIFGGDGERKGPAFFAVPPAPKEGSGRLIIAMDKDHPLLAKFMDKCQQNSPVTELVFAESAEFARRPTSIGDKPEEIPDFFEYRLKDVQFTECPVVADAPQQAIIIDFKEIEWLNYQGGGAEANFADHGYLPAPPSETTKSFVVTWFAAAHDVSEDQCPVMNDKPSEEDYYALMSEEEAAEERKKNEEQGGVNYQNGQMGRRGPNKLNVTMLPGIVRDPGNAAPQTDVARGLNLDGHDGTGEPPPGVCKHKNYVSPDGRTGIDNQLYTVQGCIPSFQGHNGFIMQFANNAMRDGLFTMLIQVTGIDDEQNDSDVEVTLFYSADPMAKDASGKNVLPEYTFGITDDPHYAHYSKRIKARIVDGVIMTDPVEEFDLNLGRYGTPQELNLMNARLRLELADDGSMNGVLAGYRDWRPIASRYISSTAEQYHGFQVPGLFNALRRAADGMKDPVTGECTAVSAAYDIEAIPAYIVSPTMQ